MSTRARMVVEDEALISEMRNEGRASVVLYHGSMRRSVAIAQHKVMEQGGGTVQASDDQHRVRRQSMPAADLVNEWAVAQMTVVSSSVYSSQCVAHATTSITPCCKAGSMPPWVVRHTSRTINTTQR